MQHYFFCCAQKYRSALEFWKSIMRLKVNQHSARWKSKPSCQAWSWRMMERIPWKMVILPEVWVPSPPPQLLYFCTPPFPPTATETVLYVSHPTHGHNNTTWKSESWCEKKSAEQMMKTWPNNDELPPHSDWTAPGWESPLYLSPTWGLFNAVWSHIVTARLGGAQMTSRLISTCPCVGRRVETIHSWGILSHIQCAWETLVCNILALATKLF